MSAEYEALVARARAAQAALDRLDVPRIVVGVGGCSLAVGAGRTLEALRSELERRGVRASLETTGCNGQCYAEPLVDVIRSGRPRVTYGRITAALVPDFVESVLVRGDDRPDLAEVVWGKLPGSGIPSADEHPYLRAQLRHVMANSGLIDPGSLEQYVARGGYAALHRALTEMTPDEVIEEVKRSQLTGRGGAAFPTGRKWETARASKDRPKYVIDNGEEGEPAVYKDRRLLESDPHRVIEGVLINGYAIGAEQGYLYVGGEHRLAIGRVRRAVEQARAAGLVGRNILGTSFSMDLEVRVGAGSYAVGESSAMMSSIEGRRGMPRPKLVRSAERGVWAKPTCMNNVETHANIPGIILNGGAWLAGIGTELSKGTKLIALNGRVNRPGLVEVPLGTPLRTLVYEVGGGVPGGRPFKAAQPAGVSSSPIAADQLDVPMAIETLAEIGALLGSGGLVVFDDTVCMVDMNKYLVNFNELESCSRCVTCRVGTMRLTDILDRLSRGEGRLEDLDSLAWLGPLMEETTLCGLGQSAPVPAIGALNLFRSEFEAHVLEKRCPAGVCAMGRRT